MALWNKPTPGQHAGLWGDMINTGIDDLYEWKSTMPSPEALEVLSVRVAQLTDRIDQLLEAVGGDNRNKNVSYAPPAGTEGETGVRLVEELRDDGRVD